MQLQDSFRHIWDMNRREDKKINLEFYREL